MLYYKSIRLVVDIQNNLRILCYDELFYIFFRSLYGVDPEIFDQDFGYIPSNPNTSCSFMAVNASE